MKEKSFSLVGFQWNFKKSQVNPILVKVNFVDPEGDCKSFLLETQPQICLKYRYEAACEISWKRGLLFSQKTKFSNCWSIRRCQKLGLKLAVFRNPHNFVEATADQQVCGRDFVVFHLCLSVAKAHHTASQWKPITASEISGGTWDAPGHSFELAANWTEEHYKSGDKTRVRFVNPGKKRYKTQKQVAETLVVRNLGDRLHEKSSTSEEDNSEGSDYDPSDEKKAANSIRTSLYMCAKVMG